jgi:TetR/AcrR family fatty acid metabolism transcriptional regulator
MPTKEELKSRREAQITRAAYELIAKNGYENITVQDIADRAGFSKGIVYYYFKSKDDVMVSLFDSIVSGIDERFAEVRRKSPDPRQQLIDVVKVSLNIIHDHKEFYHVIMVFWTQIGQKTFIRDINAKLFSRWRREITKILDLGITTNVFRKDLDPSLVASLVVSRVMGSSLQYIFDPSAFDFEQMKDTVVKEVIAMV